MKTRLISIIRKEFIQLIRDKRMLALILVIPLVQLFLLGYATVNEIRDIPLAVFDQSRSAQSRQLLEAYKAADYFKLTLMVESLDEMHEQIDRGIIKAGLIIPPDFSQKMEKGEAQVAFILDGSDPTLASPALSAAQLIGQAFSIDVMQQKIARSGLKLSLEPVVDVRTSVLYNPDMNSSYFMVPGVIGMILFAITAIITATSVVRERERGTIEQLIITPIRPLELVIGKITPYVILSLFDAFEVIAVGHFWFGVPVRGSLLVIALACSTFLFSGLGIGLFASTVANTQQESMLTVFMTYLPAIFLSGFFYPIENMPVVLQITSYFVPLRYFLNIIRALLLKGVGLQMVQNDMIALVIFGFVIMAAAALRFRKRLD